MVSILWKRSNVLPSFTVVFHRVKSSCSSPPKEVLGTIPPSNFHICSRKCLLVLGYYIGITQLRLVSQPETLISEHADFIPFQCRSDSRSSWTCAIILGKIRGGSDIKIDNCSSWTCYDWVEVVTIPTHNRHICMTPKWFSGLIYRTGVTVWNLPLMIL